MKFGCPHVCLEQAADEDLGEEKLGLMACQDTSARNTTDFRWQTFLAWAREIDTATSTAFEARILEAGCEYIIHNTSGRFCEVSQDTIYSPGPLVKALTYACPVSCNCGNKTKKAKAPPFKICPAACFPCKAEMDGPVIAAGGNNMTATAACKVPWVLGEPSFEAVAADARCCNAIGCMVANLVQQYSQGQPAYNFKPHATWQQRRPLYVSGAAAGGGALNCYGACKQPQAQALERSNTCWSWI